MRLGIKLLNVGATLNQFQYANIIKIARGETLNLTFQLVDLDQNGLRYVPAAGATVQVQLPRSADQIKVDMQHRSVIDSTIDRPAAQAFSQDGSIWTLPLIAADTLSMVSTLIRVVVVEGPSSKIATLNSAIKIIDGQDN